LVWRKELRKNNGVFHLIVCDISSFYSEQGGGVRTYHHAKLEYFARHPEHTYILIAAGPSNTRRIVEGGVIYTVRGFPVSSSGAYRQIWDWVEIRRILEEEKPDVIESGSPYLDGWLSLFGRKPWRPAVVGFYHADFPDSYMAPAVEGLPRALSRPFVGFWRKYVKMSYARFDATVVTTGYVESKLRGYGLRNTVRIPLGVNIDLFHPSKRSQQIRQELGVRPEQKLLLYCGRFSSEKGIDELCDAVRLLGQREDLRFVLVGTGPWEEKVRAVVSQATNASIHGYIRDREKLAATIASADVFLAPGPYETFGLSVLEALASGVPVVSAASGGAGEMVRGSAGGVVFEPGSGEDFVCAIDSLVSADTCVVGRVGRKFVEESFSWNNTFDRMCAVYEELKDAKRTDYRLHTRRLASLGGANRKGRDGRGALGAVSADFARGA
jgi:alpha-1,6-mannosyltransferase